MVLGKLNYVDQLSGQSVVGLICHLVLYDELRHWGYCTGSHPISSAGCYDGRFARRLAYDVSVITCMHG